MLFARLLTAFLHAVIFTGTWLRTITAVSFMRKDIMSMLIGARRSEEESVLTHGDSSDSVRGVELNDRTWCENLRHNIMEIMHGACPLWACVTF